MQHAASKFLLGLGVSDILYLLVGLYFIYAIMAIFNAIIKNILLIPNLAMQKLSLQHGASPKILLNPSASVLVGPV